MLAIIGSALCMFAKVVVEISTPVPGNTALISNTGYPMYWEREDFPLTISVQEGTNENLRYALEEAVLVWNGTVGHTVFEIREQHDAASRVHGLITFEERDLHNWGPGYFAGLTQYRLANSITGQIGQLHSASVWVDTNVHKDSYYLIVLHELGHTLGLAHDTDPSSCMFPLVALTMENIEGCDREHVRRMVAPWVTLILGELLLDVFR